MSSEHAATPQKTKRRWVTLSVLAGLVVVLIAGTALVTAGVLRSKDGGGPDAAPTSVTGSVTLTLPGFIWDRTTLTCTGYSRYEDLQSGTQVVVTGPDGKTVGVGSLRLGKPTVSGDRATECKMPFSVDNVPAGLGFYGVEVAHRGVVQVPEGDLDQPVALSLN